MTQSFLDSQIAEQTQTGKAASKQHHFSETLALSASDFSALEERIVRAVNLVKSERQARAAAEERAQSLESRLQEQSAQLAGLQEELRVLGAEREQVRQRVEKLLSQLDALEL